MSGSAIEWSPPSTTGTAPAASTAATVASIAGASAPGRRGGSGRRRSRRPAATSRRASTPASRWRPGGAARAADRARPEARAGRVGGQLVHRRADDRHVDALELGGVLGVGQAGERHQADVVRLLAVGGPAGQWIDHARSPSMLSGQTASADEVDDAGDHAGAEEAEVDAAGDVRERAGVELGLDRQQAESGAGRPRDHRAQVPAAGEPVAPAAAALVEGLEVVWVVAPAARDEEADRLTTTHGAARPLRTSVIAVIELPRRARRCRRRAGRWRRPR